jgi:TatD DNase family protein
VRYFDTHCHLNHDSFQADLDAVLKRAIDSGIEYILVPGWDLGSSRKAIELAEKHSQIVAAVGIHPSEIVYGHEIPVNEIHKLASHPRVAAIGEIGLDYYHDPDHLAEQRALLKDMLAIAADVKKKVVLHSRESMQDMKALLLAWVGQLSVISHPLLSCPGILHSYEGNLPDAKDLLVHHFKFGVGGPLTYKNSQQKQTVFSSLPDTDICFETDSPYLSPDRHRGERNEPAYLTIVADRLANLRQQPRESIIEQIFQNGYKMFIEDTTH